MRSVFSELLTATADRSAGLHGLVVCVCFIAFLAVILVPMAYAATRGEGQS